MLALYNPNFWVLVMSFASILVLLFLVSQLENSKKKTVPVRVSSPSRLRQEYDRLRNEAEKIRNDDQYELARFYLSRLLGQINNGGTNGWNTVNALNDLLKRAV